MPPLAQLREVYQLEPQECFLLHRPMLSMLEPPAGAEEGELQGAEPAEDGEMRADEAAPPTASAGRGSGRDEQRRAEYQTALQSMQLMSQDPQQWCFMSKEFFLAFWSLGLSDIYTPAALYQATAQELELKAKEGGLDRKEADFVQKRVVGLKRELDQQNKCVRLIEGRCRPWPCPAQ